MQKVEAIIKPFIFDDVKDALDEIGINRLLVTELNAYSDIATDASPFEDSDYVLDYLPKIKIELLVNDDQLDTAINAIEHATEHNHHPDDIIVISAISRIIPLQKDT